MFRGPRSWLILTLLLPSVLLDTNMFTRNEGLTPMIQPDFAAMIDNVTVPVGRDAILRCLVSNLGGYRVGWVKADTKAIQAIHEHVITQNARVSVSHSSDLSEWNLHVRGVQEDDRGQYMCQINTDPMKSQVGWLNVVVPPDIVDGGSEWDSSGAGSGGFHQSDVVAPEGGSVDLLCRARGHPRPRIAWRREDGRDIVIRHPQRVTAYHVYEDENLRLPKVSRTDMGAYLCIASNGVPPSVSKRFIINVQFHPLIQVPNQLLGAPLGTDVKLECYVEASPKSINYWVRDTGEMVISSDKYEVKRISKSIFEEHMTLTVRRLQPEDVGSYRCVAKNALGEEESSIRIYEIPGDGLKSQRIDEDDYGNNSDRESDEEINNNVYNQRDNSVPGPDSSRLANLSQLHSGTILPTRSFTIILHMFIILLIV